MVHEHFLKLFQIVELILWEAFLCLGGIGSKNVNNEIRQSVSSQSDSFLGGLIS